MDLAHPLRITGSQIIVDGNDMNALAFQRIQVSRQRRSKGLTFTGTHLCDSSLMKDDASDDLYGEMFLPQHTPGSLAYDRESFRQKIVQRFPLSQTVLEFLSLAFELIVRQGRHSAVQCQHLVHQRFQAFYFFITCISEYFLNKSHECSSAMDMKRVLIILPSGPCFFKEAARCPHYIFVNFLSDK